MNDISFFNNVLTILQTQFISLRLAVFIDINESMKKHEKIFDPGYLSQKGILKLEICKDGIMRLMRRKICLRLFIWGLALI